MSIDKTNFQTHFVIARRRQTYMYAYLANDRIHWTPFLEEADAFASSEEAKRVAKTPQHFGGGPADQAGQVFVMMAVAHKLVMSAEQMGPLLGVVGLPVGALVGLGTSTPTGTSGTKSGTNQ